MIPFCNMGDTQKNLVKFCQMTKATMKNTIFNSTHTYLEEQLREVIRKSTANKGKLVM